MGQAVDVHRLHFAFTVTFHYIFPQLTMGLALLLVYLKTKALRTGDEHYNRAARFWARIFGINFALGVITGIPMEFQFGTNWAAFSKAAGGVIGQTLAMEGVFSFFLESSFLGLFLFGEKKLGRIGHWWAAFLVFLGSWLSGYLIVATDAWMQHPMGYRIGANGEIELVRTGVLAGVVAAILQLFPTGDMQGKLVADHQQPTLAAMEGLFESRQGAPLAILGQPDIEKRRLDNPLQVPNMLSFLTYRQWRADVKGLSDFPENQWPDQIPLLYYSYHVMVGLGTIFIAVMVLASLLLWRGKLYDSRWMLWTLMVCAPLPYIANTAGWMTAELGRQPWLIYGLMRTAQGISPRVAAGNAWFTLIGFMGMYAVLSILWLFLIYREIELGPEPGAHPRGEDAVAVAAD